MNTPTKYFADKLRAAFRFFRRLAAKVVAAEPDRADSPTPPVGTMSWLSVPAGGARTWEEALGAASDAPRQQAKQPLN